MAGGRGAGGRWQVAGVQVAGGRWQVAGVARSQESDLAIAFRKRF